MATLKSVNQRGISVSVCNRRGLYGICSALGSNVGMGSLCNYESFKGDSFCGRVFSYVSVRGLCC